MSAWDYQVPKGHDAAERVYRMQPVGSDPRFTPLTIRGGDELIMDVFEEARQYPTRLSAIKNRWKASPVIDRVSSWNDIPMIRGFPAFSQRAVKCLKDLLERDGLLLPLRCPGRQFFAYVPRFRGNVLNPATSELTWEHIGGRKLIDEVVRYDFDRRRVRELSIFGLDRQRYEVYVTDSFVRRVRECSLFGANYEIVYPLQSKHRWKDLAWRAGCRHLREGLKNGELLNGKCFRIRFLTDGPEAATTDREDARLSKWAWRVHESLRDRKSMRPGIGGVTGVWPEDQGGFNVEFSGPNARKLLSAVTKFIPLAKWRGKMRITGRGLSSEIL